MIWFSISPGCESNRRQSRLPDRNDIPTESMSDETTKTQTALNETQSGAAVLLDVRTREEWEGGHFEGAVHVPLDQIHAAQLAKDLVTLEQTRRIYTYCARGLRATTASEKLEQLGFESIPLQSTFKNLRKSGFKVAE